MEYSGPPTDATVDGDVNLSGRLVAGHTTTDGISFIVSVRGMARLTNLARGGYYALVNKKISDNQVID